jgi:tetratricopeptide (TPR) repeat protein
MPAEKLLIYIACTLVFVTTPVWARAADAITKSTLRASFSELDDLLETRKKYLDKRFDAIKALKRQAKARPNHTTYAQLAREYVEVDNDSAVKYFKRALAYAVDGSEEQALLRANLAARLPVAGLTQDAIEMYQEIDTTQFDRDALIEYYDAGCRMYATITAVYANNIDVAKRHSNNTLECKKRLLWAMRDLKDTPRYRMERGEYLLRVGKLEPAEALVRDVYDTQAVGTAMHTRAAHVLSHIVARRGDDDACLYYLVNSVISDIQAGSVEVASLQDLGRAMYDHGDDERALRYLDTAMSNAVKSHAWTRMIQTAEAIPLVQEVQIERARTARTRLVWVVVALCIIMVLLIVTTVYLRRALRRQGMAQARLRQSNLLKEKYISQFLTLSAVYMDRLMQFSKMVKRKLAAGKVDDVTRLLKSGKYMDEQSDEFFAVFDDAFLHIYPTFVTDVNKLLREDAQIELREGELMNADLRLLAFMRLGIEDSSVIAQILNYSVNTVYAYRNKLKQRAVDRATFEHDIMQIGAE